MKIVKFNTLTFLLQIQLAIYNLFLYLKNLCNKEIDCLSKIIEKKNLKKTNKHTHTQKNKNKNKKKKKKKKKKKNGEWMVCGFHTP